MDQIIEIKNAPLNSVVRDVDGTHFSITEPLFGIDPEGFGFSFGDPDQQVDLIETDVLNWEEIRHTYC